MGEDVSAEALREALAEARQTIAQRDAEMAALRSSAAAILEEAEFAKAARAIFDYCRGLIGAPSGYVALLSDDGAENELLFLEAGGLPCDVDPELPMPIRGLREESYKSNRAVYDNDFMNSEWASFMPSGHVVLRNVMFAPLVVMGKTVGIIGLANKPEDFTDRDAHVAEAFGELAAIALQHGKHYEERRQAEARREEVIGQLQEALSQVKQLSGLLPICSHCKKIRDKEGNWDQIDAYIERHSEAAFTHSICKECAEKYYPHLNLYDLE